MPRSRAWDGTLASFGDGSLSYTYYDVSTSTSLGSAAPTNAGSYTVVAHYAGNNDYTAADSAAVPFTIGQATPSVSVTDAGGTYNGSAFAATAGHGHGRGQHARQLRQQQPLVHLLRRVDLPSLGSHGPDQCRQLYGGGAPTPAARITPRPTARPWPSASAKATPTVSVTDAGGTYNASAFAATGATVTGVDSTIASFGNSSLSYTYYDVSTSTSLGSTAPTNAGSYTVVATYAGSAITPRPTARPCPSASAKPRPA